MEMIDICFNATHPDFDNDRDEVIHRAISAGVNAFFVPGSTLEDSQQGIELCERFANTMYPGVGIHPHNAKEWTPDTYLQLKQLINEPAVIAIGETGLDYCRNFSNPQIQREVFKQHIDLAVEKQMTLFSHQRDAHSDFMQLIEPRRKELNNVVIHCFTGDQKMLDDYIALDFYIGITGWICDERRGKHLKDLVSRIPNNRIMVETDAPYLVPRNLQPRPKNNRNQPAFLIHIVETIAQCIDMPTDEVARICSDNSRRCFSI